MARATVTMNGKVFVLVPKSEYRGRVTRRSTMPEFPGADEEGHFPAVQTGRVSIAREIIRRREAVGLSQKALAAAAGTRVETLNRIEKARVTADTATIVKIDKALNAEKSR